MSDIDRGRQILRRRVRSTAIPSARTPHTELAARLTLWDAPAVAAAMGTTLDELAVETHNPAELSAAFDQVASMFGVDVNFELLVHRTWKKVIQLEGINPGGDEAQEIYDEVRQRISELEGHR